MLLSLSLLWHHDLHSSTCFTRTEYERLEKELADEQENLAYLYKRKKGFAEEKKQTKQQKEEAEKYNRYLEHIEHLKVQRALWKLYFLEHDINAGEKELADLRKQVSEYEQQQQDKENLLKEAQKSLAAKKKQVSSR